MTNPKKTAFHFIILMGIVSLLADITYEGARGVTGPYLAVLGATPLIVGLVAGLGEFVGYALRLLFGYFADRTKAYWFMTIAGYGLILAIPLLAFTNHWQIAAMFIIMERMGKAIRSPARDTILSQATKEVGRGWGFGIHEALDQIGAIIGPLIFSAVFILKGGYKQGFAILLIPALLSLAVLILAKKKLTLAEGLEISQQTEKKYTKSELPKVFWLYTVFIFFCVAGFVNFQLIAYHLKVRSVVLDSQIPIFYAIAMAVDAFVALIIGKTYDKIGLKTILVTPLLTLPVALFAFSNTYSLVVVCAVFWGAVMGVHETIMRAAIADLVPIQRRGFAYGIFNTAYGLAWFVGGAIMGALYGISTFYLILFVVLMELISLPIFFLLRKEIS